MILNTMMKKSIYCALAGLVSVFISSYALAAGDVESGKAKAAVCAACHGAEGISAIPANPNLAGQVPGYIAAQLAAFKSGDRANVIMAGQVAALSEKDMADLDAFYASMEPNVTMKLTEADAELAERGAVIYRGGFAERGITACMSCHGPSGHGIPKNFPRVSAQHKEYLQQQLLLYKSGERVGYNGIMHSISFGLSEQQIEELSAYMAGLK